MRFLLATLLLAFISSFSSNPWDYKNPCPSCAQAHDSWISRGALRNPAGEWCCGAGDCAVMDPKAVGYTPAGFAVSGWGTIDGSKRREFYHEVVPASEAQPSPDGAYWRCKRPDGTRRCFFAPPPNS